MEIIEQGLSKRKFLGYLAAVPAALGALRLVSGEGIAPALAAPEETPKGASGPFTLPALPYKAGALSKVIDEKTMQIHHGKHHQAYIDKLNEEIAGDPSLDGKTLEELFSRIAKYSDTVRNNAGGHWNHSFFWTIMTPEKTQPSEDLVAAINSYFGSMDEFKKKFEEAGVKQFGSGWAWLVVTKYGKLEITSTPNQNNPLMNDTKVKGDPILGNDVWEHAYYLRYQNKRADYLKSWWDVVNWNRVSELYRQAKSH